MIHPPKKTALSPQEVVCVQLVCDGLANKQIAERLHIEIETVKSYLKRVRFKYELQGREAHNSVLLLHRAIEDGYWIPAEVLA